MEKRTGSHAPAFRAGREARERRIESPEWTSGAGSANFEYRPFCGEPPSELGQVNGPFAAYRLGPESS